MQEWGREALGNIANILSTLPPIPNPPTSPAVRATDPIDYGTVRPGQRIVLEKYLLENYLRNSGITVSNPAFRIGGADIFSSGSGSYNYDVPQTLGPHPFSIDVYDGARLVARIPINMNVQPSELRLPKTVPAGWEVFIGQAELRAALGPLNVGDLTFEVAAGGPGHTIDSSGFFFGSNYTPGQVLEIPFEVRRNGNLLARIRVAVTIGPAPVPTPPMVQPQPVGQPPFPGMGPMSSVPTTPITIPVSNIPVQGLVGVANPAIWQATVTSRNRSADGRIASWDVSLAYGLTSVGIPGLTTGPAGTDTGLRTNAGQSIFVRVRETSSQMNGNTIYNYTFEIFVPGVATPLLSRGLGSVTVMNTSFIPPVPNPIDPSQIQMAMETAPVITHLLNVLSPTAPDYTTIAAIPPAEQPTYVTLLNQMNEMPPAQIQNFNLFESLALSHIPNQAQMPTVQPTPTNNAVIQVAAGIDNPPAFTPIEIEAAKQGLIDMARRMITNPNEIERLLGEITGITRMEGVGPMSIQIMAMQTTQANQGTASGTPVQITRPTQVEQPIQHRQGLIGTEPTLVTRPTQVATAPPQILRGTEPTQITRPKVEQPTQPSGQPPVTPQGHLVEITRPSGQAATTQPPVQQIISYSVTPEMRQAMANGIQLMPIDSDLKGGLLTRLSSIQNTAQMAELGAEMQMYSLGSVEGVQRPAKPGIYACNLITTECSHNKIPPAQPLGGTAVTSDMLNQIAGWLGVNPSQIADARKIWPTIVAVTVGEPVEKRDPPPNPRPEPKPQPQPRPEPVPVPVPTPQPNPQPTRTLTASGQDQNGKFVTTIQLDEKGRPISARRVYDSGKIVNYTNLRTETEVFHVGSSSEVTLWSQGTRNEKGQITVPSRIVGTPVEDRPSPAPLPVPAPIPTPNPQPLLTETTGNAEPVTSRNGTTVALTAGPTGTATNSINTFSAQPQPKPAPQLAPVASSQPTQPPSAVGNSNNNTVLNSSPRVVTSAASSGANVVTALENVNQSDQSDGPLSDKLVHQLHMYHLIMNETNFNRTNTTGFLQQLPVGFSSYQGMRILSGGIVQDLDKNGRIIGQRGAKDGSVTFSYDEQGNLTRIVKTNPQPNYSILTFDFQTMIVTIKTPTGKINRYEFTKQPFGSKGVNIINKDVLAKYITDPATGDSVVLLMNIDDYDQSVPPDLLERLTFSAPISLDIQGAWGQVPSGTLTLDRDTKTAEIKTRIGQQPTFGDTYSYSHLFESTDRNDPNMPEGNVILATYVSWNDQTVQTVYVSGHPNETYVPSPASPLQSFNAQGQLVSQTTADDKQISIDWQEEEATITDSEGQVFSYSHVGLDEADSDHNYEILQYQDKSGKNHTVYAHLDQITYTDGSVTYTLSHRHVKFRTNREGLLTGINVDGNDMVEEIVLEAHKTPETLDRFNSAFDKIQAAIAERQAGEQPLPDELVKQISASLDAYRQKGVVQGVGVPGPARSPNGRFEVQYISYTPDYRYSEWMRLMHPDTFPDGQTPVIPNSERHLLIRDNQTGQSTVIDKKRFPQISFETLSNVAVDDKGYVWALILEKSGPDFWNLKNPKPSFFVISPDGNASRVYKGSDPTRRYGNPVMNPVTDIKEGIVIGGQKGAAIVLANTPPIFFPGVNLSRQEPSEDNLESTPTPASQPAPAPQSIPPTRYPDVQSAIAVLEKVDAGKISIEKLLPIPMDCPAGNCPVSNEVYYAVRRNDGIYHYRALSLIRNLDGTFSLSNAATSKFISKERTSPAPEVQVKSLEELIAENQGVPVGSVKVEKVYGTSNYQGGKRDFMFYSILGSDGKKYYDVIENRETYTIGGGGANDQLLSRQVVDIGPYSISPQDANFNSPGSNYVYPPFELVLKDLARKDPNSFNRSLIKGTGVMNTHQTGGEPNLWVPSQFIPGSEIIPSPIPDKRMAKVKMMVVVDAGSVPASDCQASGMGGAYGVEGHNLCTIERTVYMAFWPVPMNGRNKWRFEVTELPSPPQPSLTPPSNAATQQPSSPLISPEIPLTYCLNSSAPIPAFCRPATPGDRSKFTLLTPQDLTTYQNDLASAARRYGIDPSQIIGFIKESSPLSGFMLIYEPKPSQPAPAPVPPQPNPPIKESRVAFLREILSGPSPGSLSLSPSYSQYSLVDSEGRPLQPADYGFPLTDLSGFVWAWRAILDNSVYLDGNGVWMHRINPVRVSPLLTKWLLQITNSQGKLKDWNGIFPGFGVEQLAMPGGGLNRGPVNLLRFTPQPVPAPVPQQPQPTPQPSSSQYDPNRVKHYDVSEGSDTANTLKTAIVNSHIIVKIKPPGSAIEEAYKGIFVGYDGANKAYLLRDDGANEYATRAFHVFPPPSPAPAPTSQPTSSNLPTDYTRSDGTRVVVDWNTRTATVYFPNGTQSRYTNVQRYFEVARPPQDPREVLLTCTEAYPMPCPAVGTPAASVNLAPRGSGTITGIPASTTPASSAPAASASTSAPPAQSGGTATYTNAQGIVVVGPKDLPPNTVGVTTDGNKLIFKTDPATSANTIVSDNSVTSENRMPPVDSAPSIAMTQRMAERAEFSASAYSAWAARAQKRNDLYAQRSADNEEVRKRRNRTAQLLFARRASRSRTTV